MQSKAKLCKIKISQKMYRLHIAKIKLIKKLCETFFSLKITTVRLYR